MEHLGYIIAQAAPVPVPFDWERMLMFQGPLYVLFGVFIWFLIYYGPGLVQGHRDMMKAVSESSTQTAASAKKSADSTERLTETMEVVVGEIRATREAGDQVRNDIHQLKKAAGHAVTAGERMVQKADPQDSDVVIELKKAKRVLESDDE